MKYQMNRLRDMIKVLYPYRVYRNLKRIFALLSLLMFILMIVFCFIEPEAIRFEEATDLQYAYMDIDFISQNHYQGYYIVEKDGYCYIYHQAEDGLDQALVYLQNGKNHTAKVYGVPDNEVSDDVLKGLIPIFNQIYSDPVDTIEELVYYTGYQYLDHDMTPNAYQIGICMVFTVVFFLAIWILKAGEMIYTRRFSPYFANICYRGEEQSALEELQHPIHAFYHLKAVLLPNYLVCNHPVPFMIAYEDIVMIYERHGLSKDMRLIIYDRDLKKKTILSASSLNFKSHEEMRMLLSYISEKYPNILVGDTRENMSVLLQMKSLSKQ